MSSSSFDPNSRPTGHGGHARPQDDSAKSPRERRRLAKPKKQLYGFPRLIIAVREADVGSAKTQHVLYAIASYADFKRFDSDPSVSSLAKDCRLSKTSVHAAIRHLEMLGVITIKRRRLGVVNMPNWYTIDIDRLEQLKRTRETIEPSEMVEEKPMSHRGTTSLSEVRTPRGQGEFRHCTEVMQPADHPSSSPGTTLRAPAAPEQSNGQRSELNNLKAMSDDPPNEDDTNAPTASAISRTTPSSRPAGQARASAVRSSLLRLGLSARDADRLQHHVTVDDLREVRRISKEAETPKEKVDRATRLLIRKYPLLEHHGAIASSREPHSDAEVSRTASMLEK